MPLGPIQVPIVQHTASWETQQQFLCARCLRWRPLPDEFAAETTKSIKAWRATMEKTKSGSAKKTSVASTSPGGGVLCGLTCVDVGHTVRCEPRSTVGVVGFDSIGQVLRDAVKTGSDMAASPAGSRRATSPSTPEDVGDGQHWVRCDKCRKFRECHVPPHFSRGWWCGIGLPCASLEPTAGNALPRCFGLSCSDAQAALAGVSWNECNECDKWRCLPPGQRFGKHSFVCSDLRQWRPHISCKTVGDEEHTYNEVYYGGNPDAVEEEDEEESKGGKTDTRTERRKPVGKTPTKKVTPKSGVRHKVESTKADGTTGRTQQRKKGGNTTGGRGRGRRGGDSDSDNDASSSDTTGSSSSESDSVEPEPQARRPTNTTKKSAARSRKASTVGPAPSNVKDDKSPELDTKAVSVGRKRRRDSTEMSAGATTTPSTPVPPLTIALYESSVAGAIVEADEALGGVSVVFPPGSYPRGQL